MDESELIRRAQQGDRGAFGELVRLHQARLRAFAARFVPRSEDVFDLVQDAFLKAYRALGTFDPRQEFGPWLRTICRNQIRNHWRERRVRRNAHLALVDAALEASADAAGDPGDDALERVEALRRCVDELQPSHRELVRNRYARGMAVADLARRLDRSAPALSMVLVRVRAALQKCLARHFGPELS
jgi:RNA polymerase sigma-70 factor (ECF subfamily)